jgi:hypothetical protein
MLEVALGVATVDGIGGGIEGSVGGSTGVTLEAVLRLQPFLEALLREEAEGEEASPSRIGFPAMCYET